MEEILLKVLDAYGAQSAGWVIAILLAWKVWVDSKDNRITSKDVLATYEHMIAAYQEVVKENTRVNERLATIIEERTRRQLNDRP